MVVLLVGRVSDARNELEGRTEVARSYRPRQSTIGEPPDGQRGKVAGDLSADHTSARITGGTFSYDGQARDIEGTFIDGGSLTLTGALPGCSKQTFAVNGTLILTSPAGSGSFSATLTHFRKLIFGRCITYAATVKGAVAFTLP